MKLYAPRYYKDFKCIGDKCDHSCCIGWEIDIDDQTLEKYKSLGSGYGTEILKSISYNETPHFKLCAKDRCPHLAENGLCKIILNMGEEYLCHICREHPRFYNYTHVAEVGLGMSCREAARLILSTADYEVMEEIGEVNAEADDVAFDGAAERREIYKILKGDGGDYKTKLDRIYSRYGIDCGNDGEWLKVIGSLEYLDDSHKELFLKCWAANCPHGKDEYRERALAYYIYRHGTEAFDIEDFRERLTLCLFLERLFASLISYRKAQTPEELAVLASIISEEIEYSEDNIRALSLVL